MKKLIAMLSICGCLLPTLALADELDDLTDKLLKDSSMKCTDEASTIMASHVRHMLPDTLLDGLRDKLALGGAWGPGNENYLQVRGLMEKAMLAEEAKSGPLVAIAVRNVLRTAIGSWTPAQRTEYSAFFEQEGGRLYMRKVADSLMCPAIIQTMRKPPFSLPSGAQLDRIRVLEVGIRDARPSINADFSVLPKDQAEKLDKIVPEVTRSLLKAFSGLLAAYPVRAGQAIKPVMPELMEIAKAYKP